MTSVKLLTLHFCTASVAVADFVTSVQSNFVINLDFGGESSSESPTADDDANDAKNSKLIVLSNGKHRFRCRLPRRGTPKLVPKEIERQRDLQLTAKMASFKSTCSTWNQGYFTYDVCFGRKITQFNTDDDVRRSLGNFFSRTLLASGHAREEYILGSDNRSAQINYLCGSISPSRRLADITEVEPKRFVLNVSSPYFCRWTGQPGNQATDYLGGALTSSSLLERLRDQCVNTTVGYWTYEYCFPDRLEQFHTGNDGSREQSKTLGVLSDSSKEPDQVDMSMIYIRPSFGPLERRAPPSMHKTLSQSLTDGTHCDETNSPRSATVLFQCPLNWQSSVDPLIARITEPVLCDYEVLIETHLLCGHDLLLPTIPRGDEEIQCVPEISEAVQ